MVETRVELGKTDSYSRALSIISLSPLSLGDNGMSHVAFLDPGDLEKLPVHLSIQRNLTWFNLLPSTKVEWKQQWQGVLGSAVRSMSPT